MTEQIATEAQLSAGELEQAAAGILGRMLFGFSRLDMELGLLFVWSDGGSRLEEITELVKDQSFFKKLDFLGELVDRKFAENPKAKSAYSRWLRDADVARTTRNQLVHGRWGVEASRQQIVNVIGLPTSPAQSSISYSLSSLEDVSNSIADLQLGLQKLRKEWPL